ncbi:MAG: PEGA domain-containing protein [Phycisphaerae bacterium]
MSLRISRFVVLLGLSCTAVVTLLGCDRSAGKESSTTKPAVTQAAIPLPTPVEVGGGKVQVGSRGQGNVAAIFISNRLGEKYNNKILPLQDYVVAESNAVGYSCITLENTQESIAPNDLDRAMKNEASRLALVRNLGADYLLTANLTSYDEDVVEKTVYGVKVEQKTYTLTLTYAVADRNLGGALDGGIVTVTKDIPKTAAVSTTANPFNELLRRGASELAAKFKKDLPPPLPLNMARFFVDVRVQSFVVPNIVKNTQGEYVVSSEKFHLLAEKATIGLDGAAVGTTPQLLSGPKGLHKMRVTRDGCRSWEDNISINEGAEFVIDLQLSDETLQRWKQMTTFLSDLKDSEKLSDAKAEVIKGFAQTLRQSGFKVDLKADVKADINSKDFKAINEMVSKCMWTSNE